MISCEICKLGGIEFLGNNISRHIKNMHGLSSQEYKDKFNCGVVSSEFIEKNRKGQLVSMANNPDLIKRRANSLKKFHIENPEAKIQHSEKLKKLYTDNPELKIKASETRKKFLEEHPDFNNNNSEKIKQFFKNEESYSAWLNKLQEYHKNNEHGNRYGIKLSEEQRQKISNIVKAYFQNPENREKQSKQRLEFHKLHPESAVEHSNKMKEFYKTHRAHNFGKPVSPESGKKISKSLKEFHLKAENRFKASPFLYSWYDIKDKIFTLNQTPKETREKLDAALYPYHDRLFHNRYWVKISKIENHLNAADFDLNNIPKSIYYESAPEREIKDFLEEHGITSKKKYMSNPRREIDLFFAEHNIGIEFNGVYWHSELYREAKYHQEKYLQALENNINLIQIYEHQYNENKDKVLNFLLDKIQTKYCIFGRKCIIKEIDNIALKEFELKYHMQGHVSASIKLGLFYNDELVAAMTFGKSRFNKAYEYELLRLTYKGGYRITGGASKLLSYFEKNYNPKSLISYANLQWSSGKVYESIGFNKSHMSAPSYWWFGKKNILTRQQTMKHKLKDLLGIGYLGDEFSESENMTGNGYVKVYDCGNLVYTKSYQ